MEGKLPPREPTAPPSSDEESSTESVREPWSYQNIVESTMSEVRSGLHVADWCRTGGVPDKLA